MARSLGEWIGKDDNSRPPAHVRVRIFERYKGVCHWSDVPIRPGDDWDCDHIIALINGGENREMNMAPIRRGKAHKEKTAADVAEKSRVYRKKAKHLGLTSPRQKIKSRGFAKAPPQHTATRPIERRS